MSSLDAVGCVGPDPLHLQDEGLFVPAPERPSGPKDHPGSSPALPKGVQC